MAFAQEAYSSNEPTQILKNAFQFSEEKTGLSKVTCRSRNGIKWFRDTVKFSSASLGVLPLTAVTCIWEMIETPAATRELCDALWTTVPCLPDWFFLISPVLQVSRRMWIILGVNVNALILKVPIRSMIEDIHCISAYRYPGMLQLQNMLEKPQRRYNLYVCTFILFCFFPPNLPLHLQCSLCTLPFLLGFILSLCETYWNNVGLFAFCTMTGVIALDNKESTD